jgi:hypothetical protein
VTEARKKAAAALNRPLLRFAPGFWEARAAEARRLAAEMKIETIAKAGIGDAIEGEGIFVGRYSPKGRDGESLGKTFNVFAAPQNLPETMTYDDTVKYIAQLKSWNGFDGTNYATDREIYAALKDGSYNGGWIIPPRELLVGTEPDGAGEGVRPGAIIQPDNLFDYRDKGALKETFKAEASGDYRYPIWHWSSTEHRFHPTGVWAAGFSDGWESWNGKNGKNGNKPLSCRPVRLVPA